MDNFKTCKSKTVLIILIVTASLTEVLTSGQVEVLVNESTFISCVSKEVKNIQWHHTPPGKINEYMYAGGRFYPPYDTGRFRVNNDSTTNMYTLVITDITQKDAGLYECKDDVLSGVFGSTYLTVLDSNPFCTSNMHPSGFVGPNTCNIEEENMTFSCAVSFSGNLPNLMWSTLNGSHVLKRSNCESSKDDRINCSLSVKADPSFDGSTFICQSSNDARFNCSIEDVRVEYFIGEYKAAEKRLGDNVSCVVGSNLQIHYNWTIQENNQDSIFSSNPTINLQAPGFYECSVKYNIRDVACFAPIVAVNVSNIVDDKETAAKSSSVSREQIAIGVSIAVSMCLVAVIIAFVLHTKCYGMCTVPKGSFGVDVAYTYFFSFLQIVLPGVWNNVLKEIQRPSAVNEPTEKIFLVKKMLIVIPKTLNSPLRLSDVPNFRRTDLSIKQCFDRAGKENREYTIPIYELIDKESGNVYYFVTDIPSCLFAIREAKDSRLNAVSIDIPKIRNDFIITVEELLRHPKNHAQFADQWELLLWPDDDKDKNRMELSEFVSHQIKRKDLAVKLADALNQPITGAPIQELEEKGTQDYEVTFGLSLQMKANFGVGVAYTYFFSFLQIVIPGVWNSFLREIRRPSAVNEPTEKIFLVKKMLIIIPKQLDFSLRLSDYTNFRRTDLSIKQCFDRAGRERREYTVPIYELTDKESGNIYYFVTDIPSCLSAIREAYDSKMNIMTRGGVLRTRINFIQTVKALLNHPKYRSKFADQWELLLWPDYDEDKWRMDLSEFVSHQIKSKGLAVKLADVLNQPIPESSDVLTPKSKPTFAYAGGIKAYPPYSERPHYAMKNNPRGHCIIINNFEFPGLERRSGAAAEIEALKKLFRGLKFSVDVRINLTADQMKACLKEYRDRDHLKSDAFVCCLLSHGEKGRIYATDEQIPVIKLMELFYSRNCPGLAGKPKLFFIGTCQRKADDGKNERKQSTSEEPNPVDIRPGTDIGQPLLPEDNPDLHDFERRGPNVPREDRAEIERELVPSGVDFIVSYACLPETVAWHDSSKGGLYVQALCKHLNQDLEINTALGNVSQEVINVLNTYEKEGKKYSRQDPFHIITPPQKFLFLGSD